MDNATQVAAVAPGVVSVATVSPPVSSSARALNSAVSGAVRTLNESRIVGEGREVTFSLDRATHIPVIKVVDTSTKEVINQWPPEYAILLAESTQGKGQIQDESILRTNDTNGQSG